jgi:hypothetical protein
MNDRAAGVAMGCISVVLVVIAVYSKEIAVWAFAGLTLGASLYKVGA